MQMDSSKPEKSEPAIMSNFVISQGEQRMDSRRGEDEKQRQKEEAQGAEATLQKSALREQAHHVASTRSDYEQKGKWIEGDVLVNVHVVGVEKDGSEKAIKLSAVEYASRMETSNRH